MQGGDKVDIKTKIRESGINQWEVAERVGVGEVTLVRWLRRPERLDAERLAKVEAALQQLIKERSVENGSEHIESNRGSGIPWDLLLAYP